MSAADVIGSELRDKILQLARRHGARNLRVFGSVARGEARADSDVDLLVEWEPGRSLLDHAGLVADLEELLGRRVHIGTEKALHWYVRDKILSEAIPL
jgi:predicted nucleotidyltransferase